MVPSKVSQMATLGQPLGREMAQSCLIRDQVWWYSYLNSWHLPVLRVHELSDLRVPNGSLPTKGPQQTLGSRGSGCEMAKRSQRVQVVPGEPQNLLLYSPGSVSPLGQDNPLEGFLTLTSSSSVTSVPRRLSPEAQKDPAASQKQ